LDHPGGALFADHFPPVNAGSPESHLHRRVRRDAPHVADLDPLVALFHFGWKKQIHQGGQTERGRDHCPKSIDGDYKEIAAAGAFAFGWWDHLHVPHRKPRYLSVLSPNCIEFAKTDKCYAWQRSLQGPPYFISGLFAVAGSWPKFWRTTMDWSE